MTNPGPIGVFDSGVGGLAVAAAIRRLLPHEPIVYFADSANFPYGPKPAAEVLRLTKAASRLLLSHDAKLVVVACNTASSAALAAARSEFPHVPIVGMVPAVKPATAITRTHRVGVLATEGTLQGQVLADLVAEFADGVNVEQVAAPELADLVEFGEPGSPAGEALVRRFVEPLLAHDVDVIVLGCTHFAFLRPQVERLAGPRVLVLETAGAIARQVERVLREHRLEAPAGASAAAFRCFTSGDPQQLRDTLGHLRGVAPDLLPRIDAIEPAGAGAVRGSADTARTGAER